MATSEGLRAIETIRPDDQVWAFDLAKNEWRLCRVAKPYSISYKGTLVLVTIAGDTTEATYEHLFWVVSGTDLASRPKREHLARVLVPADATMAGRWVDSCDLRIGDMVLLRDGRSLPVQNVQHRLFDGRVYNMEVDDLHCYTVGRNGALVHNENGKGTGETPNPATKNRVKPRKATREQIDEAQPRSDAGEMIDPNTNEPLTPGEIDLGHKPGNEWRTRKKMHEERGSTREEVIEAENDPDLYWWEDRTENRSHRHEAN